MQDDALILIGVAILLQLGLWLRSVRAIESIERRLDSLWLWADDLSEEDEHEHTRSSVG